MKQIKTINWEWTFESEPSISSETYGKTFDSEHIDFPHT